VKGKDLLFPHPDAHIFAAAGKKQILRCAQDDNFVGMLADMSLRFQRKLHPTSSLFQRLKTNLRSYASSRRNSLRHEVNLESNGLYFSSK
jgi:hypothetical protein